MMHLGEQDAQTNETWNLATWRSVPPLCFHRQASRTTTPQQFNVRCHHRALHDIIYVSLMSMHA
jgi:hypothetical protein